MILLLKCERVVIVTDWTKYVISKIPKKGSEVSTKEEGAKHSKINLGIRSPTVCYLMIVTVNIKSHQYQVTVNINNLITVNVIIIFIISSSLAVMTMTVKKTEKRQQKFFTNQVGSLKPQSRWIWSWSKKDYENVVIVFVLALIIIIRTAVHYLALSPLKIQIPISITKIITTNSKQ